MWAGSSSEDDVRCERIVDAVNALTSITEAKAANDAAALTSLML